MIVKKYKIRSKNLSNLISNTRYEFNTSITNRTNYNTITLDKRLNIKIYTTIDISHYFYGAYDGNNKYYTVPYNCNIYFCMKTKTPYYNYDIEFRLNNIPVFQIGQTGWDRVNDTLEVLTPTNKGDVWAIIPTTVYDGDANAVPKKENFIVKLVFGPVKQGYWQTVTSTTWSVSPGASSLRNMYGTTYINVKRNENANGWSNTGINYPN